MKFSFKYGTTNISFNVEYKDRKTMEIEVEPPNIITVIAPLGTTEEKIVEKVKGKANWIIKQIYSYKHMHYIHINREFVNGESFMYLGRNYSLQIKLDLDILNVKVRLFRGEFMATASNKNEEDIRKAMEEWYRERANKVILEKVKYYQRFFSIIPTNIKIKEQKKRWGSCTSKNELLFNWRCIMAKANALDYIIVHEMCHMYHKNHSKEFWELVASIMPDYEIRKEWLKNYGVRMDL